jgi:hypothetical protein
VGKGIAAGINAPAATGRRAGEWGDDFLIGITAKIRARQNRRGWFVDSGFGSGPAAA